MVQTGISDEVKLLDSSGSDLTDDLGIITGASHTIQQSVDNRRSVGQGAKPVASLDNVASIEGGLDCQPPNLEVLRVFGSLTDNGDGTYTITLDDNLPTHTLKQEKVDTGGTVNLKEFKFGSFTLEVGEGDTLSLSVTGQGSDVGVDTSETFDTPDGDFSARQFFDCKYRIDGTVVGSVDSISIDHNRGLTAFKGIEDDATGEKRLPSEVIEEDFSLSFNVVINIEDNTVYEEALDSSSTVLEVQDSRSVVDQSLIVDTNAGEDTLKLKDTKFEEVSADQSNDGSKRTVTLTGVARDAQVDGDLRSE